MPLLIKFLRVPVFEADPLQAGLQVDFEQREADPSKYSISQNLHPPEDEIDGAGAPYDGSQMGGAPGGMPGGMPGGEGGMPGQPPADEEMQQIQPGMQQPGQQQMPPMQEGFMTQDDYDDFLDDLLEGVYDTLTEAPPYPEWAQRGNAPQTYRGVAGPQQAPPSIAAGGPAAVQNWQRQMQAVGGNAGGGNGGQVSRPPSGGGGSARAPLPARPAAGGGRPDQVVGGGARPSAPVIQAANRTQPGAGVPDFTSGRASQLSTPGRVAGGGAAAQSGSGFNGVADRDKDSKPTTAAGTGMFGSDVHWTPGTGLYRAGASRDPGPQGQGTTPAPQTAQTTVRAPTPPGTGMFGSDVHWTPGTGLYRAGASRDPGIQVAKDGPLPAAQRTQAAQASGVNQAPPATNSRFYQQNPGMKPPAAAPAGMPPQAAPTGVAQGGANRPWSPISSAQAAPAAAPRPAQSGPDLVPGGALRPSPSPAAAQSGGAPSPAAAAQSAPAAAAQSGPNLVPGGALSTPQTQPTKEWAMTWRDFMMLHEADQKKSSY